MLNALRTIVLGAAGMVSANYIYDNYVRERPEIVSNFSAKAASYALGKVSQPDLERYVQRQFSRREFRIAEDTVKLNSTVQRLYCAQKQNTKYRGALQCDSRR
ncbi:MAG: hypothetical protein AABX13_04515 [Nanoarchaeota archaeon]